MTKTKETQIFRGFMLGVAAAAALTIILYFNQQQRFSEEQRIIQKEQSRVLEELQRQLEEVPKIPEEKIAFPDFYVAENEMKKAVIVKNSTSFVNSKTSDIIGSKTIKISREGIISKGYLLVRASVDEGRPLTIYDSVYLTLNNIGGHLLRNKTIKTPEESATTLLYPLRSIPYLKSVPYDESKQGLSTNWLDSLNLSIKPVIFTFLSSSRTGGLLDEILISYECDESTPDCSLTVL